MMNRLSLPPAMGALIRCCRAALLWLWAALLAVALLGCSSAPSYGGGAQSLSITILPNHSKQFVYRLSGAAQQSPGSLAQAPRYMPDRRDYNKLQRRAAYVVSATGYCREGYMELDFRLNMQQQWLRGECKESATDADIKTYAEQTQLSLDALGE